VEEREWPVLQHAGSSPAHARAAQTEDEILKAAISKYGKNVRAAGAAGAAPVC